MLGYSEKKGGRVITYVKALIRVDNLKILFKLLDLKKIAREPGIFQADSEQAWCECDGCGWEMIVVSD